MPPTTVGQPASLEPQQRDWLKKMAAALAVKVDGPAPQTRGTADVAPPTVTSTPDPAVKSPPVVRPLAPPVQEKSPTPKSPEQEAYEKERDEVKALVDALNKHAHKAHIAGELASIKTELGKAKIASQGKKWTDAMKALEKAKEIAGKAKDFADKYDAYAKKRASAKYLLVSFKSQLQDWYVTQQNAAITAADTLAKPPTRNYAGATTKVETIVSDLDTALKDSVTATYITPNEPKIQALKTGAQKDLLKDAIKACEDQMKVLKANIAAKEYNKTPPAGWKLDSLVNGATAVATGRTLFEAKRKTTVAAIDALKAFKALSAQMDGFNKRLAEADDLASLEHRQYKKAEEALTKIESDAKALAANGPAAETNAKDRVLADKAFEDLSKHPQAAAQKPLLDGIKVKLDKAAELAKDPSKVSAANAELQLATKDIEAAKSMLGVADAMGIIAGVAADAASCQKSLDALKISLDVVRKFKSAADFANEFKAIDAKVATAEKKLKDPKTVPDAIQEIKGIGDDIAELLIQLTQQEGYSGERATLDARLQKVKALPEAAEIQANITPIETALKDAETEDKAHAFDKRAVAMEKAREAADVAEKSAEQAKAYKTQKQNLETGVTGSALSAADKKQVTDAIKSADKEATALNYDEATKQLAKAESNFETLQINGFAKKSPPDLVKIKAAAERMMKSGNEKEIDTLIQKLPNTSQHAVLKTLAKERFGVELASNNNWSATQSGKRLLLMMSKVPDDVRGNPSLTKVDRRKTSENGGWYESKETTAVVNGRPGEARQEFGPALASQLPADIEPDCKPKTTTAVDHFDFTALHELGHSVDDKLQFMASHEGQPTFANWKAYLGAIEPIADAVAEWAKFNSTPEQKNAISDLIQGNQVTWPAPAADATPDEKKEWNDAITKIKKWHKTAITEGVWESESKTTSIKVKTSTIPETVFHLAYSRQWVSYDYAARKQGLTGYQFRAPGEWFAELYAAYRMDKLQDSHPAVKWLSNLTK